MEPVGIGVFALAMAGAAFWSGHRDRRQAARTAKLRRDLHIADGRVTKDFHSTRRAMNDAAGQSWRNLAG